MAAHSPVWAKRLAHVEASAIFRMSILACILIGALNVGLETDARVMSRAGGLIHWIDRIVIAIFVLEALMKLAARWPTPLNYFKDGWNVFDFTIVVVCLVPTDASEFGAILRTLRVLRTLRLLTAIPRLRLLVSAVLHSLPSMGYVILLAGAYVYVYAVIGTHLFGSNDPVHFRSVPVAALSLFRTATLEDWTDIMYINMYGSHLYGYTAETYTMLSNLGVNTANIIPQGRGWIASSYFVSFVIIGALIVLNLFVAVMLKGMEEAQRELERELLRDRAASDRDAIRDEFRHIESHLDDFRVEIGQRLQRLEDITEEHTRPKE